MAKGKFVLAIRLAALTAAASQTNWVESASWFREVDGQLYNTERSARFQNFSGNVEQVLPHAIVLQKVSTVSVFKPAPPDALTAEGNLLGSNGGSSLVAAGVKTVYGDRIFITNFPDALQPTTGSLQRGRAMKKGTVRLGTDVLQLWDYGTPHRVAVVTTNEVAGKR